MMSMSAYERRVGRLRERYYEQVAKREALQQERQQDDGDNDGLKAVGGGYYELPNGERVRGKEAALEALAAIEAGEQA